MPLSGVSAVVGEGFILSASTFARSGNLYAIWVSRVSGTKQIQWKKHTDAEFTEVAGAVTGQYSNITALIRDTDDRLIVFYDDDGGSGGFSSLYQIVFHPDTGAVISGPTFLGPGMKPSLLFMGGVVGPALLLVYANRVLRGVYLRESRNYGVSWSAERPALSNYTAQTENFTAVPYDSTHVAIAAVGKNLRSPSEFGIFNRTRPLVSIVPHPTLADRYFVSEPSQNVSDLADLSRGFLVVSRDGTTLYKTDGTRIGLNDDNGSIILLNTSGTNPSVVASATGAGSPGRSVTPYSLVPAAAVAVTIPGVTQEVVSGGISNAFLYLAEYSDVASLAGQFVVLRLSDSSTNVVLSSISAAHAVAVGMFSTNAIIFVATLESAQEKLRIYTENDLTPTLQSTHKLPARVNALTVEMTSAVSGTVYVSLNDRVNIYSFSSLTGSLRLINSYTLLGIGKAYQIVRAPNGNLICAMGQGGVAVITPSMNPSEQLLPSGIIAEVWRPQKVYSPGSLVRPTPSSFFAPQHYYYRTSGGGTSGVGEPAWASAGSVLDNSVTWTPQNITDPVVTGIALDNTRKRIYAVGLAGGPTGTEGRVWTIDGMKGLV